MNTLAPYLLNYIGQVNFKILYIFKLKDFIEIEWVAGDLGTIIEAKCKCGFTSGDIYQGGGMSNFQKIDMEPAICLKCKKFLVLDYKLKENKCPYCGTIVVFYNDKSLQALADKDCTEISESIDWGEFKLPNTTYLCPNCGELSMQFYVKGCWD